MYQLYYLPSACSLATHTLLCHLGQPYQATAMTQESIKSADFLKLNPRGNVPVLLDEGFVIRENIAIITYLCDKHGCSGWTKDLASHERATQLQWLAYCNATLHGAYTPAFKAAFGAIKSEEGKQEILAMAQSQIQACWDELNQVLASRTFLSGDQWGPADLYMTVVAGWNQNLPMLNLKLGDNVQRVINSVSALPAFQQATTEENVTYSVAA